MNLNLNSLFISEENVWGKGKSYYLLDIILAIKYPFEVVL